MSTVIQREIHAQRGGLSANDLAAIMKDGGLNAFTQAELLCSALGTRLKEAAREHYRLLILGEHGQRSYANSQIGPGLARLRDLGLERSVLDAFTVLPPYSLGIELTFRLAQPYISQDDDAFYIIDNPVRKEKVFKVPYMAPTSWKGSLRAVAIRRLLDDLDVAPFEQVMTNKAKREELLVEVLWPIRVRLVRLFGNEKQNEADFINAWLAERLLSEGSDQSCKERYERMNQLQAELNDSFNGEEGFLVKQGYRTKMIEGRQGRLRFFPTYFDQIGLEIINPHERERGVGTNPILFECVPASATGRLSLLYVPFDYQGVSPDELQSVTSAEVALRQQIQGDLPLLADVICHLLTVYGFGAKTSSGYGTAEDRLAKPGQLALNAQRPESVSFSALSELPEQARTMAELLHERGES